MVGVGSMSGMCTSLPKNSHVVDDKSPTAALSFTRWLQSCNRERCVQTPSANPASNSAMKILVVTFLIADAATKASTTNPTTMAIPMFLAASTPRASMCEPYVVALANVSDPTAPNSAPDIGSRPIGLSPTGLPSTVLPPADPAAQHLLEQALQAPSDTRRAQVAQVAARYPRWLDVWAALGDLGRDPIERYAAYRVGYHRGLDTLRANGWRGSGYVRWAHPTNRGFLRSLAGLGAMAAAIGEVDEAERIGLFVLQLDPGGVPVDVTP